MQANAAPAADWWVHGTGHGPATATDEPAAHEPTAAATTAIAPATAAAGAAGERFWQFLLHDSRLPSRNPKIM